MTTSALRSLRTGAAAPKLRRGLALPLALLAVWWLSTHLRLVDATLVVPPAKVLATARAEFGSGELWLNLRASLVRDFAGVGLGAAAGVALGGLLGLSRLFDRFVSPTFNALKQVALFAWIPLISVWFGQGEPAKIVFIALAAFYPVVVNTHQGIRAVSREHVEVARVYRFGRLQLLRKVVLPSAAPSIFAGLHLALIYGWLGTIGAEYLLSAGAGIGNLMVDGREHFQMDKVILGLVVTGLVGFALNSGAGAIERRALRWRRSA